MERQVECLSDFKPPASASAVRESSSTCAMYTYYKALKAKILLQVKEFGGMPGVADQGMLESAAAIPRAGIAGGVPSRASDTHPQK